MELPSVNTIRLGKSLTDTQLSEAWESHVTGRLHSPIISEARGLALGLKAHVGKLPERMYTDVFKMIVGGFGQSGAMALMGDVVYLLNTIHTLGGVLNMDALLDKTFLDSLTNVHGPDFHAYDVQMGALLALDDLPEHLINNLVALTLRLIDTKETDFACLVLCHACFWGNEPVSDPIYKRLKELETELHLGVDVDETIRSGLVKHKRARVEEAALSFPAPSYPAAALRRELGLQKVAKVGEKRARE
jgi:hypothetical protein